MPPMTDDELQQKLFKMRVILEQHHKALRQHDQLLMAIHQVLTEVDASYGRRLAAHVNELRQEWREFDTVAQKMLLELRTYKG